MMRRSPFYSFLAKPIACASLLMPFTACTPYITWKVAAIRNRQGDCDLAKLSHPPSNSHRGMELELIRHGEELYGYLNAHCGVFPQNQRDPKKAEIYLTTPKNRHSFILDRLEGGERLRLTKHCVAKLVELLTSGDTIQIQIGYFSQTIAMRDDTSPLQALFDKRTHFMPEELITLEFY